MRWNKFRTTSKNDIQYVYFNHFLENHKTDLEMEYMPENII